MNYELYNNLKYEINNILENYELSDEETKKIKKNQIIKLYGEKREIAKTGVDNASSVMASFYECLKDKQEFNQVTEIAKSTFNKIYLDNKLLEVKFNSIIEQSKLISIINMIGNEELIKSLQNNTSKFLSDSNNIETHFNSIVDNENLINVICNLPDDNQINKFYEYVKNASNNKAEDKYKTVLNKIEDICKDKEFIKKSNNDIKEEPLKIGEKKYIDDNNQKSSVVVDKIIIDPVVLEALQSGKFNVCRITNDKFKILIDKIQNKRVLNNLDIDLTRENDINTLKISTSITEHDKIASTDRDVVGIIRENIKAKKELLKSLSIPIKEYVSKIKDALLNTSSIVNEIKNNANKTKTVEKETNKEQQEKLNEVKAATPNNMDNSLNNLFSDNDKTTDNKKFKDNIDDNDKYFDSFLNDNLFK